MTTRNYNYYWTDGSGRTMNDFSLVSAGGNSAGIGENDYSCVVKAGFFGCVDSYRQDGSLYGPSTYGLYNQYPSSSHGAWPDTWLKNLGKLQSAIRGHEFDAGMAFAETEKTIAGILNSTRVVLDLWKSAARLDLPGFLRALARLPQGRLRKKHKQEAVAALKVQDISGAFLAVRYGWEPLISDIYEGIQAFEKRADQRAVYFKVTSHKERTLWYNFSGYGAWVNYRQYIQHRCRILVTPSQYRLLGLQNPAAIIWERTPFSFVVDWFIPIGNYLSCMGFFTGLEAKYATTETWKARVVKNSGVCANGNGLPHYIYCQVPGSNYIRHVNKQDATLRHDETYRTANASLSVPLPRFKDLDKALSTGHLQNAAALIHQLVSSAKR